MATKNNIIKTTAIVLFAANSLLTGCIPNKNGDKIKNIKIEKPSINVTFNTDNTLPGQVLMNVTGTATDAEKIKYEIKLNKEKVDQGYYNITDNKFSLSKIIESNLTYNITPIDIEIGITAIYPGTTTTAITQIEQKFSGPLTYFGKHDPRAIDNIIDIVNNINNKSIIPDIETKTYRIILDDKDDFYLILEKKIDNRYSDYSNSIMVFTYPEDKKYIGSVILIADAISTRDLDKNLTYEVEDYYVYKEKTLEEFVSQYFSKVATPSNNDNFVAPDVSQLFDELSKKYKAMKLSEVEFNILNAENYHSGYDVEKAKFIGTAVIKNYALPEDSMTNDHPVQTLNGIVVYPKNNGIPHLILYSTETKNLLYIGSVNFDNGDFCRNDVFLNSPYLRILKNVPYVKNTGYTVNKEAIEMMFDKLPIIDSKESIFSPKEFQEHYPRLIKDATELMEQITDYFQN